MIEYFLDGPIDPNPDKTRRTNKEKNYEKFYAQVCDVIIGLCHGSNGDASWDKLDNVQTWPRHVGHIQR